MTPNSDNNPYASSDSRGFQNDPRKIDWADLDALVRTSQIIVIALVTGLTVFTGIVLSNFNGFQLRPGMMTWLSLALGLGAVPMSLVVPSIVSTGSTPLPPDESAEAARTVYQQMFGKYQVQLIIACGVLEGAGFFNVIAFTNDSHPLSLAVAGVCTALILTKLPTKSKIQNWIAARIG